MACKYCAEYMRRAAKIENFEAACAALRLDPKKESEWPVIVKSLGMIGQFGTIRLARRFPFVTDEDTFRMVAKVGLHFYWMMLDVWDELSVDYYRERAEIKAAKEAAFDEYIAKKHAAYQKRDEALLEQMKITG